MYGEFRACTEVKKMTLNKDHIADNLSIAECLRKWEPHQKKGYDPNEIRISDIFECWTGEKGPGIGLVGIPFDSAVLGRKGAKGGPKKIRDSVRYFKAYDWSQDFWFGWFRIRPWSFRGNPRYHEAMLCGFALQSDDSVPGTGRLCRCQYDSHRLLTVESERMPKLLGSCCRAALNGAQSRY